MDIGAVNTHQTSRRQASAENIVQMRYVEDFIVDTSGIYGYYKQRRSRQIREFRRIFRFFYLPPWRIWV